MHRMASIVGVGVDIVEVSNLQKARFKRRVAEYFLTGKELKQLPHESRIGEHLASRFALKEAVIKAFPEPLSPFDFSIEKRKKRPSIVFADKKRNETYIVLASLTHTASIAAAVAIVQTR